MWLCFMLNKARKCWGDFEPTITQINRTKTQCHETMFLDETEVFLIYPYSQVSCKWNQNFFQYPGYRWLVPLRRLYLPCLFRLSKKAKVIKVTFTTWKLLVFRQGTLIFLQNGGLGHSESHRTWGKSCSHFSIIFEFARSIVSSSGMLVHSIGHTAGLGFFWK